MINLEQDVSEIVAKNSVLIGKLTPYLGEERARISVEKGIRMGATHVIVWLDSIADWEPIYITPEQDVMEELRDCWKGVGYAKGFDHDIIY